MDDLVGTARFSVCLGCILTLCSFCFNAVQSCRGGQLLTSATGLRLFAIHRALSLSILHPIQRRHLKLATTMSALRSMETTHKSIVSADCSPILLLD